MLTILPMQEFDPARRRLVNDSHVRCRSDLRGSMEHGYAKQTDHDYGPHHFPFLQGLNEATASDASRRGSSQVEIVGR
jgi:hypothetical protein